MAEGKWKVAVAGGAGYTGGELLRMLLLHPRVEIAAVLSRSQVGLPVSAVHQDLLDQTDLVFTDGIPGDVQALFLCLGHGESRRFMEENALPEGVRVIDLTQDFRHHDRADWTGGTFVYGLPEVNREKIQTSRFVANPGCFATAIQLALLPLAQAGLLSTVHLTGITGSTGAGQSLSATSHFSWRHANIQAYKTLTHQHIQEITETLTGIQPRGMASPRLHFVPWRGDFPRGIFVSCQVPLAGPKAAIGDLYREFYASHPFVGIQEQPLHLKQVVNTNRCQIQLESEGDILVIHSALDNLIKGASGQAIQNLNLLAGWPETEGLRLKASYF